MAILAADKLSKSSVITLCSNCAIRLALWQSREGLVKVSLRLESPNVAAAAEVEDREELLLKRETPFPQTPEVLLLQEQASKSSNSSTQILMAMTVHRLSVLLGKEKKSRRELTW